MNKLITSFLLLTLPLLANAYDIAVENSDGVTIYYNYYNNGTELEVTRENYYLFHYSGVVNIPEEVTYMGRTRKVTNIGEYAFSGFGGLTSVTIPNSVTSIGRYAFNDCTGLTFMNIPNSVTKIGDYAFHGCSGLTSVTIPNSLTSIGGNAFFGCHGLTSVIIPNSVTIIGEYAFSFCTGLTSVTIPNSVTNIGDYAFKNCSGLTSVISKMENPCNIDDACFHNNAFYNATLYVPKGTTELYKSTDYWSKFLFIEEGEPGSSTQPDVKKCATPTISYADKRLTFSCTTEGVEFVSKITDADIKDFFGSSIDLAATYEISVYATKSGYTNSDVATATLVWTDAIFTETTETPTSAKAVTESIPVLISANGGVITVKSEQDGQKVEAYAVNGQALGAATIQNGQATIATPMQRGEIVIVKVGNRSVKIKM